MEAMLTSSELAEALRTVDVKKLAAVTGLAEKTIYRLRNQAHSPTLATVEKLLIGIKALKSGKPCAIKASKPKQEA